MRFTLDQTARILADWPDREFSVNGANCFRSSEPDA
jgi:hypothetical protein